MIDRKISLALPPEPGSCKSVTPGPALFKVFHEEPKGSRHALSRWILVFVNYPLNCGDDICFFRTLGPPRERRQVLFMASATAEDSDSWYNLGSDQSDTNVGVFLPNTSTVGTTASSQMIHLRFALPLSKHCWAICELLSC
jgi:hypothetical protein